jgi:hypothetical protein
MCEYCDATSILLPDERDSVPSGIVRPGAILCLTDDGGLLDVERDGFMKLNIDGAIL